METPAASSKRKDIHTCNDSGLCTWWHDSGEVDAKTQVSAHSVRQSRKYRVQVSKASDPKVFYDSFVYETIPRNGKGRVYSPWDDPSVDTLRVPDDGISIELEEDINMAWTQFEHSEAVNVKILPSDGGKLGRDIIIRPTCTSYSVNYLPEGALEIQVPFDIAGHRFSVEFQDDLYTYYSDGHDYIKKGGEVVSKEPRNALLIFASPPIPPQWIPDLNGDNVHKMTPGPINKDSWGSSEVLYFPRGIYWMNSDSKGVESKYGENHIKLHPDTTWVHFAPGAYIKGAIEYTTKKDFYATGHGVLSGEHYVYQANIKLQYQAEKDDRSGLRMWSHYDLNDDSNQKWVCIGPTINSPPFNTMDFYHESKKEPPSVSIQVSDYKQVGAFFMQTDGLQVYPNSSIRDIFYHANDDAIKMYYSHVKITNLTVWKVHNDPIIQMGWTSRNVTDVKIDGLNIIHTRYRRPEMGVPSAIIGASPSYIPGGKPDLLNTIRDVEIQNVVCECASPALLRITPLQNYEDFKISDVSYPEGLQHLVHDGENIGQSIIRGPPAAEFNKLQMDLHISNWTIKGEKVTMDNFQADRLGQFNIDAHYWGQWSIE